MGQLVDGEHLWVEFPPILIPDGLDKGRGGGGSTAEGAKAQSAQMFQPVTVVLLLAAI